MLYYNWTPESYSKHPWRIDTEVYIYDESDMTDAQIDEYFHSIAKTLKGEAHIVRDYCGDRGFSFYAEDADTDTLYQLLGEMEERGCCVDYPDWEEWMTDYKEA